MNLHPHPYQLQAKQHILSHPSTALWMDMGLGKSSATLMAVAEMKERQEYNRVLIVAPVRVVRNTWPTEINKWDQFKGLTYTVITGGTSPKKRGALLNKQTDIHLINYELLPWLVELYGDLWPYDVVVFDEFSKMKSSSAKRFKAMKKVRKHIDRVVGLTGTPASNGLMDLWSQSYLLDSGVRLGTTYWSFRNRWFRQTDYMGYSFAPRPGAEEEIHQRLADICLSMSAADYLTLPDRVDNVIYIDLPTKARTAYEELETEFITQLADETITALNAAAMANKCLQAANGAVYNGEGEALPLHDEKLQALDDVIEEAAGAPVLVAYTYKSDARRIQEKFKQAVMLGDSPETIEQWNAGEIPLLLAHPASAGHGLNLQDGGNLVVWFGLSWSLENYQQFNARLHRQGQTKPVFVHHIVARDSIDEKVLRVLGEKEGVQRGLLEAVRREYVGA